MKILHIINNLTSGGAEKLLTELLPLLNNKYQVDLLLLNDSGNVFEDKILESGINLYYSNKEKSVYNPIHIKSIYKYMKEYDVIHVHLFPAFYWACIANILLFKNKKKIVMTEHNTYNRRRNIKIFRYIDKFIYKFYDKVISISKGTDKELRLWLNVKNSNNKFYVINNGIDLRKINQNKNITKNEIKDIDKDKDDIILCMVARFTEQKDHKTLIKALTKLPQRYKLLLVGEGEKRQEIEELVKINNLDNRVKFLGFRKDVYSIMSMSDICILSSNFEGFGLVAVEAMATGTPLLASNVEGLRDVVNGGGIIFEVGNAEDLANKVIELMNDNVYYKNVSVNGLNRSKQFDIKGTVYRYSTLYNEIYQ